MINYKYMTFIEYFIVSKLISIGIFHSVISFRVYDNPERLIQGLSLAFEIGASEGEVVCS